MLPIALVLFPALPFLPILLIWLSRKRIVGTEPPSQSKELVTRLGITLALPAEWLLYRYLAPRQQMYLGLEPLRTVLFAIAAMVALFFIVKAFRANSTARTDAIGLAAFCAAAGVFAPILLYVWICNLAFLLPGTATTRALQVTSMTQDRGRGSSHSDTVTGQMEGRVKPIKIQAYRFDGPDSVPDLMSAGEGHFCDLHEAQPGDTIRAVGRTTVFGFAINHFEAATDKVRAACIANEDSFR